jgi:hypothetical protein
MATIAQLYTDRKPTDDLFDGTFQQKILDVDKMIFKTKIELENE